MLVWAAVFFSVELAAVFWRGCPWDTLTGTVRAAIQWWHLLAGWITVLFIVLYGHFENGWRARYLIAWAIMTAAAIAARIVLHGAA